MEENKYLTVMELFSCPLSVTELKDLFVDPDKTHHSIHRQYIQMDEYFYVHYKTNVYIYTHLVSYSLKGGMLRNTCFSQVS